MLLLVGLQGLKSLAKRVKTPFIGMIIFSLVKDRQDYRPVLFVCLTPNTPLFQLWCSRSKWNMDLKMIFSS